MTVDRHLPAIAVRMLPRDCECCGGQIVESLWRYVVDVRTRSGLTRFDVNIVVCRDCGFVFVAPVFDPTDLTRYYASAFSVFAGQAVDYDVGLRLSFLVAFTSTGSVLVEIGPNHDTEFQQALRKRFSKVVTVEPNDSVDRTHAVINTVPDAFADVVTHYFVLEHVPTISTFLDHCHRILKPDGVMICEVPDISLYPINPVALQLYEHTNHFSRSALRYCCARAGFVPLAEAEAASRTFGFAMAFRKSSAPVYAARPDEYLANRTYVLKGLEKLQERETAFQEAKQLLLTYRERGTLAVLWAANDVMAEFLRRYPQPPTIVIIDTNPAKRSFLDGYCVMTPMDAQDAIREASAIFLFTRNHAADILESIETEVGKRFDGDKIHVVDLLSTKE